MELPVPTPSDRITAPDGATEFDETFEDDPTTEPVDPTLTGPHWTCEGGSPFGPCVADVRFSVVPEPSSGTLAALSVLGLACWRRARRRGLD